MVQEVPKRPCGCPRDSFHYEETCKRGKEEARRLNELSLAIQREEDIPVAEREVIEESPDGEEWITFKDIEAWMKYHGLDMNKVRSIDLCREGIHMNQARCYIRAEVYMPDSQGKMFADWSFGSLRYRGNMEDRAKEAAFEVRWIPLRKLPGQV